MIKKKKEYTPFPPAQLPSKVDLQQESGEYFLSQHKRKQRQEEAKANQQADKTAQRQQERQAAFLAPKVRPPAPLVLTAPHRSTRGAMLATKEIMQFAIFMLPENGLLCMLCAG